MYWKETEPTWLFATEIYTLYFRVPQLGEPDA